MEMERIFKMHSDRLSRRVTLWVIVAVVLAAGAFTLRSLNSGAYVPVWFVSIALAVGALYILSIPLTMRVGEGGVEVHCVLELVCVKAEDLRSVKRLEAGTRLLPLLGSFGFFGYFGYYLDWRRWDIVRVYTRRRSDLVEIEDIYEQRYIVSCDDPDGFIAAVEAVKPWPDPGRTTNSFAGK